MSGQALELNGWGLPVREHQADLDRFCQTCLGITAAASYFSSRVFRLVYPLLAVPLFGLLRIRVTDEASKRAVHAFACRDEPMPLAVDGSPNTKRRSFLVLCLRPGQTPLSVC